MHDAFMVTLVTNVSYQNFIKHYDRSMGLFFFSDIGPYNLLSVTEQDMTECRLNLNLFTSLMHQYINMHKGRDHYRLLISIVEHMQMTTNGHRKLS